MTRNDDDLAKLNLFRMAMSPIGNLIVTALTLPFINMLGGGQQAWITVCAIYSIVAFFMLLFCYKGCQERFHTDAAKEAEAMPFAQRLKATLKNKYFIVLTLTMIAVALYQNVNGTVATYYAQYMLGNVEVMGVMQSFENIPKIIAIICLAPFIKKFGGGVAGWLVGQLMEVSGFTGLEVEIPSAISMVKNLYIYGNMIAWALVIILMLVYHLDKEYDGIMKDLTGRTA